MEGIIWVSLPGSGAAMAAAWAFEFIAQVGWPILTPLAIFLIEPNRVRRWMLLLLLALGSLIGINLFSDS